MKRFIQKVLKWCQCRTSRSDWFGVSLSPPITPTPKKHIILSDTKLSVSDSEMVKEWNRKRDEQKIKHHLLGIDKEEVSALTWIQSQSLRLNDNDE